MTDWEPAHSMKLCHIGWAWSIHVRRWVKWFADRGHESHLITDSGGPLEGVMVHQIPPFGHDPRPRWQRLRHLSIHDWRVRRLKTILWVRRKVREIAPDVVHAHSLWYPGYLGALIGFQPYVVTVLDGDVIWNRGTSVITRIWKRVALRKAKMVFAESQQLLAQCHALGTRSDRLCCSFLGGVNLNRFNTKWRRSVLRAQLGLPERGGIVLSPRSLEDTIYNIKTIIKSIPLVLCHAPETKFVLIWHSGTDQQVKANRQLVKDLEVEDAVIFAGHVDEDLVALYHRAADIFVSLALMDSGPKALKEAMASGDVPVVGDLACVREWITDGVNGYIVDPLDADEVSQAIVRLLVDPEMRSRFANLNVRLAKQFDEKVVMPKMERAYLSVL